VGVFVARFFDEVRVAVTGASGRRLPLDRGRGGAGRDFRPAALDALEVPEDGMIADIHGTAAYRAHLVGVMTRRAVAACASRGARRRKGRP
jgi:aerobic carbon-monoxide dehydrogenase medium subunit